MPARTERVTTYDSLVFFMNEHNIPWALPMVTKLTSYQELLSDIEEFKLEAGEGPNGGPAKEGTREFVIDGTRDVVRMKILTRPSSNNKDRMTWDIKYTMNNLGIGKRELKQVIANRIRNQRLQRNTTQQSVFT
jgi:hypothetical protein